MRWKPRSTDVVEKAATAIYEALQHSIDEHNRTVETIRRDLKAERDRD